MKVSTILKKRLALLNWYTVAVMVLCFLIVTCSLIWSIYSHRNSYQALAKKEALSAFKRDEAIRLFLASRGGVYVPLDKRTQSNPYLNHPERDITTTSGKKLTLMNGAYFFHKVMEEFGTVTPVKWRLTSLKPTNSENKPDEWERKALLAFQQGVKEMIELSEIKGELYVRSLSPLMVEESCLKCHAYQGYKVGEIRGAMGVILPMAPYLSEHREHIKQMIWTHVIFILLGFVGIGFASKKFGKRLQENIRAEEELEEHRDHLGKLVEERTAELREEINERKRVEGALRSSEEQLSSAMEIAHLGHWEYDVASDLFTFNDHFYKIFSTTAEQVGGYTMSSSEYARRFLHPDDMPLVEEENQKAIEANDPHFNRQLEHRILNNDGTVGYIVVRFFIVKDSQNRTVRTYGVNQDITERKRLEEEREEMETRLQQAQKMESIGTLAGGIAHDFNNILFPIVGYTEMLLEDVPEDSPLRNKINEIYSGTLRARDLVKQILTFSRQGSNEIKLIEIQPVIREALNLIRSTIPTSIEIKQYISNDCGIIKADPTQIHQIVMNLATNAYHAMEDTGGKLKVSLKEIKLGEQDVLHPDIEPGNYACLTVADTGVGMDKDLTGRIFDPFFTTKENGKGTGMGLSVIHGIVKSASGSIHVYSEPGKGTEFHVYLPVVKSSLEQREIQTTGTNQGGTERILLVDDEEVIVTMEKQMLERLGYQVVSRTSSLEALEAFRANPGKYDLVITDMAMPNMSGDKLASELIRIRPDIPVLLCTGFSEKMPEERANAMGIKGFLMKPIVMKDLSKTIREVLDNKESSVQES